MAISKYELCVKPHLEEISDWYPKMTEEQIADKLHISRKSLQTYKKEHEELRAALQKGRESFTKIEVPDLKRTLYSRAKGGYYTEKKRTYVTDADGDIVGEIKVEETMKYIPPDTGAIHLLLKNYDDTWRNDDKMTMDLKKEKLEIEKLKAEEGNW